MKNWWILSTALLFLTGCYQAGQPEMDTYAQSNLRAPNSNTPYPYQASYPYYDNRLPQQPMMQQAPVQQTAPQQPSLIQTIVIPQTPGMGYPAQQMPQAMHPQKAENAVYPSWATPEPQEQVKKPQLENMLYLKRPGQSEIVHCAIIDAMCIASYQQQGYTQVQAATAPQFAGEKDVPSDSDYPSTATSGRWRDNNNIPRW